MEQYELNLLLAHRYSNLNRIGFLIELVLKKANQVEQVYASSLHAVFKFYVGRFRNKSMQLLTKLLVLVDQNMLVIKGYKHTAGYVQDKMEKLLKKLLKDFVGEELKLTGMSKVCFLTKTEYDKCAADILQKKLAELNRNSVHLVFDRVVPNILN